MKYAKTKSSAALAAMIAGMITSHGSLAADVVNVANADGKNPFGEGTGKGRLSVEEKASLLEYAENSRALLDDALGSAKGKGFAEANKIYLSTIKKVVIASYGSKPRSELLLRVTLNQALELTFGVPTSGGNLTATPGVLAKSTNQELLTVILEDSIKLAMGYYEDDRKAIQTGSLVDLPYIPAASKRMALAQKWLASVIEWKYAYDFSVAVIQQWLNTAVNADSLHQTAFAEEIVKADNLLQEIAEAGSVDGDLLKQRTRYLRGAIRKLLSSLAAKQPNLNIDSYIPQLTTEYPNYVKASFDFKIGDTVYSAGGSEGEVKAIFPNGDVSYNVRYQGTYTARAMDLGAASGCSWSTYCVNEGVVDGAGRVGTIRAVFSNGKVLYGVKYQGNFLETPAKLALSAGRLGDLRIGSVVYDKAGREGSVAGFFPDGTVAYHVRYQGYFFTKAAELGRGR